MNKSGGVLPRIWQARDAVTLLFANNQAFFNSNTMRIHYTDKLIKKPIRSYEQPIMPTHKPVGFWYGFDDSWYNWCKSENFELNNLRVKYQIQNDKAKILVIDSLAKLDKLTREFGNNGMSIAWNLIAMNYDGIEIPEYYWSRRFVTWYYGWDCASGCIWNNKHTRIILANI